MTEATTAYPGGRARRGVVGQLWPWIALAVAIRLVVSGTAWMIRSEEALLQPDSRTYISLAGSIAANLVFGSAPGEIEVFRAPGYPWLIALGTCFRAPIGTTFLIQLAMTPLLMILVFKIVVRATGRARIGRWAAVAVGLEPTLLLWSTQIMPETLFAAALLAFVGTAQRVFERPTMGWAAAAAATHWSGANIHPIAYPLAILLVMAAVGWPIYSRSRSEFRLPVAVFAIICVSLLGAWHVRNGLSAGYFGFSTQIDHALYLSGAGAVRARIEGARYADVRRQLLAVAAGLPATAEPGRRSRFQMMRETGWHTLRSSPVTFASVHAAGTFRTLFDPGAVEYFRVFGAYPESGGLLGQAVDRGLLPAAWELARTRPGLWWSTVAFAVMTWPYVLFTAWWGFRAQGRRHPVGLLAAVCAAYLLIAGGGVPGSSRFRAPAVPLLVLSAALARHGAGRAPLPSPAADR